MRDGKPVNWVEVAVRLTQYINDNGPRQFDSPLEVLDYLDKLEAERYSSCILINSRFSSSTKYRDWETDRKSVV